MLKRPSLWLARLGLKGAVSEPSKGATMRECLYKYPARPSCVPGARRRDCLLLWPQNKDRKTIGLYNQEVERSEVKRETERERERESESPNGKKKAGRERAESEESCCSAAPYSFPLPLTP
ncbi:unnamed protein product [Symbiodinium sp. CCMP2592]|nr:unnamed protein product [Symbiodinium sp. CCMP2592]